MQKTLLKLETSQQRKEYLQELCDSGEYEVSLADRINDNETRYIPFKKNAFAFMCHNRKVTDIQEKAGEITVSCYSRVFGRDVEHYIRKKKDI